MSKKHSRLGTTIVLAAAGALVLAGVAVKAGSEAKAGGATPRADAAAAEKAKPPAETHLVPIPLDLPKPANIIGTPRNVPPGTRVRIPKDGIWRPRGPLLAPKGVRNLARGKAVTASDSEPIIGALDMVTDGNKEAVESAYVELGPEVQWVQIDLGKPHSVYAVVVWHEHGDRRVYHDVVVQVADDKDFITNVRTLFNNDHDNSAGLGIGKDWGYFETEEGLLVDAKGIKARYVRLYSNGSTGDEMNRYTEVSVFGLEAEAAKGDGAPKPAEDKAPLPLKLPHPAM